MSVNSDLGPPRWVWLALVGLAGLVAVAVVVVVVLVGATGLQRIAQGRATSDRNDCRAQIQQARRDVLDQLSLKLDVDRTSHDLDLGESLLGARLPNARPADVIVAEYLTVHDKLVNDRDLAMTLPAELPDVDAVVDHGGVMPVLHDDGTVTQVHFKRCPTV